MVSTPPKPADQVLVWCQQCERDFVMDAGNAPEPTQLPDGLERDEVRLAVDPCPVCPASDAYRAAAEHARSLEPFLLHVDLNEHTMQRSMNELCAQGWVLRDFKTSHSQTPDGGEGSTEYVALFMRVQYDRAAHTAALKARLDAELDLLRTRRWVETAVAQLREG